MDSDNQRTQQPYLDLEHFPSAQMVVPEAQSSRSVSPAAAHTVSAKQQRRSREAHPCQPEDLGEFPPLEAVPPLQQDSTYSDLHSDPTNP